VTGSRMREEMQAEEDAIQAGRIHNWHDDTPAEERELERPMRHHDDLDHTVPTQLGGRQGERWCRTCNGTGLIPVGGNPASRDPQCQPDMDDCPVCSR
jgi:hypothetical protein